ncbi:MAG: hypothetical protein GX184_09995 [Clostridiaceae bacterium]|nr:hypothetical protein [Clostridiaceae bacterium]
MDKKEKIKKLIDRMSGLIKESEDIMEQIPEYLRPNQEYALNLCKKQLAALELEYTKL